MNSRFGGVELAFVATFVVWASAQAAVDSGRPKIHQSKVHRTTKAKPAPKAPVAKAKANRSEVSIDTPAVSTPTQTPADRTQPFAQPPRVPAPVVENVRAPMPDVVAPGPTLTQPTQPTQPTAATVVPPPTAAAETVPAKPATSQKTGTVTNVFADQDLRQVISEVGNLAGVTILADASVKGGEVSIEFREDTVESALEKLSIIGGFLWKKKGEMYLVSSGVPDAPLFNEFAKTKVYVPRTQPAETLYALLLRSYLTYAQLDKSANLISITAPERQMTAIWESLVAADGQRRQFVVEALVTEIKEGSDKQTGFSWSWRHFAQGDDQGLSYAKASAADIVHIKNLISNNEAVLRANPSILAVEGREASLTVGTETYLSLVTGNSALNNISLQRVNTGITLKLTGFVEEGGALNLHLQPEVSDVAAPINGNPSTTIRRVDTYLRVEPGQTIALAGLIQDTSSNESHRIPLLGDLPLLGKLFRNSRQAKQRTEVVILITPRLVESTPAKAKI